MKNQIDKQNKLIEKILKILEPIDDITTNAIEDKVCLHKDKVQFGFIKNDEIYLISKNGSYNKLLQIIDEKGNFIKDKVLLAATEAYWFASGKTLGTSNKSTKFQFEQQ